jgi:hypothetical protein
MFNYNNNTLSWLETSNNTFVIKILDNNEQILQKTTVNTNKYHIEACLTSNTYESIKTITINSIDEAGDETEPTYKYYLHLANGKQPTRDKNQTDYKCLTIQLDTTGQDISGFTLPCTQNVLISINAHLNKVLEYYIVTINDSNGFIIPPKYIYTPKGYPGYINPPPLEVLLTQGNYTVWVNGRYL